MTAEPFRIPLLRDRHTHPLLYAALADGLDLNRDPGESRDEAVGRIRARARSARDGWTVAYGWNSGRYDLAKEAFDDLPPVVVFDLSLHGLLVNDAGRARLRRTDPAIAAHLDDQGWVERNMRRVHDVFALAGASADRLRRFYGQLLEERGVYYAEEMLLGGAAEVRLFEEAGLLGRTRFWASPEVYEGLPGPIRERVYGVKLFADGALGAGTAALHQPYRGTADAGMLLGERAALERLLRRYLGAGTPVAVHAIGDRAIDEVVAAVEAAGPPAGGEVRVEHAQLITEPAARRAKALGLRLCMQPNFSDDSVHYADRLPAGYPERNNPFRMLIDEVGYVPGEDLVFGSDGMPHGAAEGLRQALFPPHAGQVLTVEEFVAGYGMPSAAGHVEVRIDAGARQVACRTVLTEERPAL